MTHTLMRIAFVSSLLLSVNLTLSAQEQRENPTAEELLQHINDRDSKYTTRVSSTAWNDSSDGVATAWSITTIHQHEDGRIRVRHRHGAYDEAGRRVPADRVESEELYNGSITVHRDWHPDHSEVGEPLTGADLAAPHGGYHSAMVWDGLFSNPRSNRTPWGVGQFGLTYALKEIVEDGHDLTIERLDPDADLFRVTYQRRVAEGESPGPTYMADIDGDRGWIVPRIEGHDAAGRLVSEDATDFMQDESGLWVPVRGVVRRGPTESGTWSLDWQFETLRFEVGADVIVEDAFDVIIEPNTSIYDVRHQVRYRAPRYRRLVNPELELYALETLLERLEQQQ